ncbi:hypothetical protein K435DRAFT_797223 [Dendrothele bispora CBS 962.96]|uniref:Uncharacterized protein n=1 Tax=Dendrothele bispora (strain CBS 962.96) TaxID=1314807 RepID=A0A4S8M393_DENBC|nr:hypothetical protein K435DRAFT_797223 [Dendrothele bispora CBS 962.96]
MYKSTSLGGTSHEIHRETFKYNSCYYNLCSLDRPPRLHFRPSVLCAYGVYTMAFAVSAVVPGLGIAFFANVFTTLRRRAVFTSSCLCQLVLANYRGVAATRLDSRSTTPSTNTNTSMPHKNEFTKFDVMVPGFQGRLKPFSTFWVLLKDGFNCRLRKSFKFLHSNFLIRLHKFGIKELSYLVSVYSPQPHFSASSPKNTFMIVWSFKNMLVLIDPIMRYVLEIELTDVIWGVIEESWDKEPKLRPSFDIVVRMWGARGIILVVEMEAAVLVVLEEQVEGCMRLILRTSWNQNRLRDLLWKKPGSPKKRGKEYRQHPKWKPLVLRLPLPAFLAVVVVYLV